MGAGSSGVSTQQRIVRVSSHLRVVTDEPPARRELVHKNIRKFSTITNTLARVVEVREALRGHIEAWLATLSSTGSTPHTTTRN